MLSSLLHAELLPGLVLSVITIFHLKSLDRSIPNESEVGQKTGFENPKNTSFQLCFTSIPFHDLLFLFAGFFSFICNCWTSVLHLHRCPGLPLIAPLFANSVLRTKVVWNVIAPLSPRLLLSFATYTFSVLAIFSFLIWQDFYGMGLSVFSS